MITKTGLTWRPHTDARVHARIGEVLESWLDTPYQAGQLCKGVAVDCVRFMAGFLDEMYGFKRVQTPLLPQDTAFHDKEKAIAAMEQIVRIYSPNTIVTDGEVEPGDVINQLNKDQS